MSDARPVHDRHATLWIAVFAITLASAAYSAGEEMGKRSVVEIQCPRVAIDRSVDAGEVARCVP